MTKKLKLTDMLTESHRMEEDLLDSGGEFTEESEALREGLEQDILHKMEGYAFFIKNKGFEKRRGILQEHIDTLKSELNKLTRIEDFIKAQLVAGLEKRGPIFIEIDGIAKQIEIGYSKSKTIQEHLVPKEYGVRSIENMPWGAYSAAMIAIKAQNLTTDDMVTKRKIKQVDLPEDHIAFAVENKPKVNIVNKRKRD